MAKSLGKIFVIALLLFIACACHHDKPAITRSGLQIKNFQTLVEGKSTDLFILHNKKGMEVCLTNYGCRIVSIMVPDRKGNLCDVALGFDSITDYIRQPINMGATVGYFAGFIRKGQENIGKKLFPLKPDEDTPDSNKGKEGFQNQVFDARQISDSKVVMTYMSKNGKKDSPGSLVCTVTFKVTDDNALDISYTAEVDCPTLVNMSTLIYFNLAGNPAVTNTDNRLMIHADAFLPLNSDAMPQYKKMKVKGTPMDFRTPKSIGKSYTEAYYSQIKYGKGFDHYYLLHNDVSTLSAELYSPDSGIMMTLYTTAPCLYFYSGNKLDGIMRGKRNAVYEQRSAVVLSPQQVPVFKSPYSSLLEPGEKYASRTILKFSVSK